MPGGHLYPAPSHTLTLVPIETSILSNGNHITAIPEQPVTTPISRFCSYQRRSQSKSTPTMGVTDSKSLDSKLNVLFDIYKDENEDAILAEGIEQLCKDLQVCPDEFKVLVLAWKLNAEQMCKFTRLEFVKGLKSMRADSIKSIQTRLPEIVNEVGNDPELFKDLYRFTFKFGLDSVIGQRILPSDMAVVLWKLVFTVREPPILNRWLNFLDNRPVIRGIPRDTWNMFLNFSETVGNDLSSYDDNEAWPSLFDDFVEYENDHTNQNISKDKECEIKENVQREHEDYVSDSQQLEKEYEITIEQQDRTLKDLRSINNMLQNKVDNLQLKLEQTNRENTLLTTDIDIFKEEKENLSKYVRELEQKNDDLERAQRVVAETVGAIEVSLNSALERNAILESEVDEKECLKEKLQRLADETRDLKQELYVREKDKCPDNERLLNGHAVSLNLDSNRLKVHSEAHSTPLKQESNLNLKNIDINTINAPLSPASRLLAVNIVGEIIRKVGSLEAKLGRCRNCGYNNYKSDNIRTRVVSTRGSSPSIQGFTK
ncbi:hypothetical protein FQA39_LY08229 [Lamprigera yunnana]|nr:hypothetical protein FQA39_LY08229 [Lamprigera yunnana]